MNTGVKLAFIGDVHLGNHRRFGGPVECSMNRRCRQTLDVLRAAVTKAHEAACDALVVDGDLFDTDRPEPQLVAVVQDIFTFEVPDPFQIILLVGNHDQKSVMPGDHALGPLRRCARIVEAPEVLTIGGPRAVELGCIPFKPGQAAKEWLPVVLAGMFGSRGEAAGPSPKSSGPRLLAVHLGVSDDQTPKWLVGAPDSIDAATLVSLCGVHGIEAAFAGNWHDRRTWEEDVYVFQTGALVPTGWDNPGFDGYGTLVIWEDKGKLGEVTVEELPGPRFVKHTGADLDVVIGMRGENKLYISWSVMPDDMQRATSILTDAIAAGLIEDGEVLADSQVVEAAARSAAHAARSATSLDAAVDDFVGQMALDEGVDREAVRARARGYLGV